MFIMDILWQLYWGLKYMIHRPFPWLLDKWSAVLCKVGSSSTGMCSAILLWYVLLYCCTVVLLYGCTVPLPWNVNKGWNSCGQSLFLTIFHNSICVTVCFGITPLSSLFSHLKTGAKLFKGLRINANDRTCLKTTSPEAAASAMAAYVFPLTWPGTRFPLDHHTWY